MKTLWAPWRISYILGPKEQDCFFCREGAAGVSRETLVLAKTAHSLVILNRYPYTNGHIMVAPLRHVARPWLLSAEESSDLHDLLAKATRILETVYRTDGINLGMNLGKAAGAGIEEHMHYHLVPRWFGDTNAMTVCGDVRVIPEELVSVWERLKEGLDQFGQV